MTDKALTKKKKKILAMSKDDLIKEKWKKI